MIQVTADEDDLSMNNPQMINRIEHTDNMSIDFCPPISKIYACNHNIDKYKWDICFLMSDDMSFTRYGWDKEIIDRVTDRWRGSTDFFAHFNDGFVGDKLPTMNICGYEYYKRFNYLYYPEYKSVSCDAENMYVAQMLGRHNYWPDVFFSHDHPANLKHKPDALYKRNHVHGEGDTKLYFERLRRGFDVINPVFIPEVVQYYMNQKVEI